MKVPTQARRLVSIDALRGMAAMAVVAVHAGHYVPTIPFGAAFAGDRLIGRLLASALSFGPFGVYLFFVISGFCIHLRWAAQDDDRTPDFFAFWKQRIFRLYPPYLLALAAYTLLDPSHRHIDSWFFLDVGLHAIMAHNLIASTTYSLNLVFWTLAIEEQLYLLYFLLLVLRRRFGWGPTMTICFLARAGWFFLAFAIHRVFHIDVPVQEGALAQWFGWALGALSIEHALGRVRLPAWATRLPVGLALLFFTGVLFKVVDQTGPTIPDKLMWFASSPLLALSFFFVVNAMAGGEMTGRSPSKALRLWARIGLFSYSLYLVHELVVTNLADAIVVRAGRPDLEALCGIALIPLAVGFGYAYYVCVERRFIRSLSRGASRTSERLA